MKKIITLCLVLVPLIGFSQKKELSLDKFFNKYSEMSGYESLQVTEDMFEMFKTMEDADDDMVAFMSKLKFVKYLEYEGLHGLTTGVSVVTSGKTKGKTTNFYVDGKKVETAFNGDIFQSITIGKGSQRVKISYDPYMIKRALVLQFFVYLVIIISVIMIIHKKMRLKNE